jgi:hypothetical protein
MLEKIEITSSFNFHNVSPAYIKGEVVERAGTLYVRLTPAQERRLKRYFCGVKGCLCYSGSPFRLNGALGRKRVLVVGSGEDSLP